MKNSFPGKISFYTLIFLAILAFSSKVAARPNANAMDDLYDDVANFFDAVSLDEIATSGRASVPETFCRMPARKGVCRALIPRWSYDPKLKDCVEFKFGGCDGNENNFGSYKQCMDTCQGM